MADYYFDGGIDPANGNNEKASVEIPEGYTIVTNGYVRAGDKYYARKTGEWVTLEADCGEPCKDFYCLVRDSYLVRVLNGIELLTLRCKGWLDKINLEILELASDTNCVLGQIFDGDYMAGRNYLFAAGEAKGSLQSFEHGFTFLINREERDYGKLTAIWRAEILRLRKENSSPTT